VKHANGFPAADESFGIDVGLFRRQIGLTSCRLTDKLSVLAVCTSHELRRRADDEYSVPASAGFVADV
jgi:hypothetical protein